MKINKKHFKKLVEEELKRFLQEGSDDGLTIGGNWPPGHPMARAQGLARGAMQAVQDDERVSMPGEYTPPGGNSVTDEDVIRSIYNHLMEASGGWRQLGGRFMEMMQELGGISIEGANRIRSGQKIRAARLAGVNFDVDADDMEASLERFAAQAPKEK